MDQNSGAKWVEAVEFASRHHGEGKWKDGETPFLFHPLAVAALVLRHGGTPAQAQAAVLHDTIGDGNVSHAELTSHFGAEVADLVFTFADPLPAPAPVAGEPEWVTVRKAYLAKLREQRPEALLVVACEELHEVSELLADLRYGGFAVWKRYPVHSMQVFWYFREILAVVNSKLQGSKHRALLGELAARVAQLNAVVFENARP